MHVSWMMLRKQSNVETWLLFAPLPFQNSWLRACTRPTLIGAKHFNSAPNSSVIHPS